MLKKQLYTFILAITFFTRIPILLKGIEFQEYSGRIALYLPLIGWIVGGFGAVVYLICHLILPSSLSLLISMLATIWITGAFHEDGFADVCDGFGGGSTKDKVLSIMKDSRLGTYGTLGLFSILALKYMALYEMSENLIVITLISAHSLSRWVSISLMLSHEYVASGQSKAGSVAVKMPVPQFLMAGVFGIAPLIVYQNYLIFLALVPIAIVRVYFARLFSHKIGGYTGDCLGAVQQVSELAFYLFVVAVL
ncbi:MAG: adenosylcobinamide-GDP ribazoletransferase [bacterium]|nr:MAG: adenosylcobinamide-GDP ribazoletransferase [bacterium]